MKNDCCVQRLKYTYKKEFEVELHPTVHAANWNHTFCGCELNQMWWGMPDDGRNENDVTCEKCLEIIAEDKK